MQPQLVIGRRYVTRNGTQVHVRGAQYEGEDGSTTPGDSPQFEYYAEVVDGGNCLVRYRHDGAAVDITYEGGIRVVQDNNLDIIDELDNAGEPVAGEKSPPLDDDPVHPQVPDEDGPTPDVVRDPPADGEFDDTLVRAVLDGKIVQMQRQGDDAWEDLRNRTFAIRMLMQPGTPNKFRLKPEAAPKWIPLYRNGRVGSACDDLKSVPGAEYGVVNVVRLLIDPATGEVLNFMNLGDREHQY